MIDVSLIDTDKELKTPCVKGSNIRRLYTRHIGFLSPEINILHRCDHGWCINIRHWWFGTISDNNQDCSNKGRHVGCRKVTPEQVKYVRSSNKSLRILAKELNVTRMTIYNIRTGRTWPSDNNHLT